MTPLRDRWAAAREQGRRLAALTAYDFPMAKLLDEAGLDFLLVGDSLGMVILGRPDTVDVTLEEMLHHTRAAARGARKTPLAADLPREATSNPSLAAEGARALREAGAQAVKIEGGLEILEHLRAIREAGVEVIGHLGMLPQRVREEGGYRVKGRRPEEAAAMLQAAMALEQEGAAAIVLELVEPTTAQRITESLRIPTIGIGSGPHCAGDILVTHDLVGLTPWFRPPFVRPRASLAEIVQRAAQEFARATREGVLA